MVLKLKKVGSISYPQTKAETMVIGSDNATLRLAYRNLLENVLGIDEYFFYRNKGVIDSLADNPNRDRPLSIEMIKKNLDRGVRHIVVVTHVDYSDCKNKEAQLKKRSLKVESAEKAARIIRSHFPSTFINTKLKVEAYIIVICGDEKVYYRIQQKALAKAKTA